MSALPAEYITMKDSPTYLPILRSVLKSQIQFLVEQLSDAGEETLLLSANVGEGLVDQLGSESGKLFVDVYDDFKSEFLGFCQRRKGKRKLESPQKTPVDVKRGKGGPAVIAKAAVQSVKSPQNVPKVSSARIIVSQKPVTTQAKVVTQVSTPGNQFIQVEPEESDMGQLGESEEDFTEMEDTGLGYDELEDVQPWQGEETEEGVVTPSSNQQQSSSSQEQLPSSRIKTSSLPKVKVTTQKLKRRIFHCDKCGKTFGRKNLLNTHALRHGEKTFHCDKCPKKFFTITELRNHCNFMHFEGERKPRIKFVCEHCDARYARKENLLQHIRIKHEKVLGEFACDMCDKTFHCKRSLSSHVLRHGEKNFQCSKCAMLFFTVSELNVHDRNKHSKDKVKKDDSANTAAVNLEKLFSKALSCDECGKLFMRPDALEIHKLCHTKEKPFTCHICGLGYRKKFSYEQHMTKKHPELDIHTDDM